MSESVKTGAMQPYDYWIHECISRARAACPDDAADGATKELQALRADNERLRGLLREMIAVYSGQLQNDGGYTVLDATRAALGAADNSGAAT